MNNKGQTLVLFVLLIPIFLILFAFVIDTGFLYQERKHIDSSLKETLEYGLNHINNDNIKEELETLINKNIINTTDITVYIEDDIIHTNIKKDYQGIFMTLFKNNIYEINISYYGYIDDNNKFIINKE